VRELRANVEHIETELPKLSVEEALRSGIRDTCAGLTQCFFLFQSELAEIVTLQNEEQFARLAGMALFFQEKHLKPLNELVLRLDDASTGAPSVQLAYILVAESTASIMKAQNAFVDAVHAARPGGQ
jgi:hypothetical protein